MSGERRFLGLPTQGAMGTEPALTVGGIIAAASFIVGVVSQLTGFQLPHDLQVFFDQNGVAAAGAVVAIVGLIQAWVTRQRVVSPATASGAVGMALSRSVGHIPEG